MEILSRQRPQIVSGDFSTNLHPFWPCHGSLESSNPTLFNHMGTSHFNTSYSIRSCSFLSKFFLLILTGSTASKGITNLSTIGKQQPMRIIRSLMTYTSSEHLLAIRGPSRQVITISKGCKYNVVADWETGEKTYEPLSVLAADDPATCATDAKENDLLHVDCWKSFRNLAIRDKILTRAVIQSSIRQARRSNKYMFAFLIPKSYKEALEFDKENNNTKWADATRDEMDCIKEQEVFITCQRAKWDSNHK